MPKYAVLSDIHGNGDALRVVLAFCREKGVDEYVSLGDIVGYNAEPSWCLQTLRKLPLTTAVKGNHDEYAAFGDESEIAAFNTNARIAIKWTRDQLSEEERNWLTGMMYRSAVPGANATLVHATLDTPETWGYIFDVHHASDNFAYQFTQLCFCGHSHSPLAFLKKPVSLGGERSIEIIDNWVAHGRLGATVDYSQPYEVSVELRPGYKYLLNVGSIGQPRNNDPRASFCIYDTQERMVTRYMLPYDIAAAQSKILAANLPVRLAERLAVGV